MFILISLILVKIAMAPPPVPKNIDGYIYHTSGAGVEDGIPVTINNTANLYFKRTSVNAPPSKPGVYSATIEGSVGDIIIVKSWNTTNFGVNSSQLQGGTTSINVVLNNTRSSETNTTIAQPQNNTVFNISTIINVTANITIIGGQDGINCNATISIGNSTVLNVTATETITHDLGNIALGQSKKTTWNISSNMIGTSNITVIGKCESDEINFDNMDRYSVYNITIQDIYNPIVSLESPTNNSIIYQSQYYFTFKYNVTDNISIVNCSLIINNIINKTNYTIIKGVSQNFLIENVTIGQYNWSVNCTDAADNNGGSDIFNLTIYANAIPQINNLVIEDPIDLLAGTLKTIYCNASIRDSDGIQDIQTINATLYDIRNSSLDQDDNNYHYTNITCLNISSDVNEINISCGFNLWYYSNNGSWVCNITAMDLVGSIGSDVMITKINPLIAIDLSDEVISYGELKAGDFSIEDQNITIINLGNMEINMTLMGYGFTAGDNLSMVCPKNNIPSGFERYSLISGINYNDMVNLTGDPNYIINLSINQRQDEFEAINERNTTYWKMMIPVVETGNCNGSIIFAGTT